jgi:hypothetical protein
MSIPEARRPLPRNQPFHLLHGLHVIIGVDPVEKRRFEDLSLGVREDLADLAVDSEEPALDKVGNEEHDQRLIEKTGNSPLGGRFPGCRLRGRDLTDAEPAELPFQLGDSLSERSDLVR